VTTPPVVFNATSGFDAPTVGEKGTHQASVWLTSRRMLILTAHPHWFFFVFFLF
jgi:hypothetical protein